MTSNLKHRFKNKSIIGEGAYGKVYKAFDTELELNVAIKKVKFSSEEEGIPASSIREISLLKELSPYENIIELYQAIHLSNKLYLIFELCDMDLKDYMKKNSNISLLNKKVILFGVIKGIHYCHSLKIMHRDIKPQNILLKVDGDKITAKLADFGLARGTGIPSKSYSEEVVTLWYRPPDLLLGNQNYNSNLDIWGFACIFVELYNNKPLFPGQDETEQLLKIFKITGTPNNTFIDNKKFKIQNNWKNVNKEKIKELFGDINIEGKYIWDFVKDIDELGADLLCKMLCCNPEERIGSEEVMNHEYFNEVRNL